MGTPAKRRLGTAVKTDAMLSGLGRVVSASRTTGEGEVAYLLLKEIQLNPHNPRKLTIKLDDVRAAARAALDTLDQDSVKADEQRFLDAVDTYAETLAGKSAAASAELEALSSLARQIVLYGLLHPVQVRRTKNDADHGVDEYELVAGERRYLAHHLLGRESIRAIIRSDLQSEVRQRVMALVENLGREDLSFGEKVMAFSELLDLYQAEHPGVEVTAKVLQGLTGESRRSCFRYLRCVNSPPEVYARIQQGDLTTVQAIEEALGDIRLEADSTPKKKPAANRPGRRRKHVTVRVEGGERARKLYEACAAYVAAPKAQSAERIDWTDLDAAQAALEKIMARL